MFFGGFKLDGEVRTTFCEQKVAKKLFDAGAGALTAPTPMAQRSKSFLLLFFKKAALTCLLLSFAPLASAQTQSPASKIPVIIVHVSPLGSAGVDISKWPHPVQVLGGQDLRAEGTADLTGTLARKAAGVSLVNSQANPYQPTILYHGFEISPIQGTPAGLSVYVNGARFNQPFGDLALWSVLPDEAIASLSVEDGNPVFGLNALGGAVNVVMKNGFTAAGGQAELSGGSFGKIEGNLEYGREAGDVAAYVDLGETHEAGWRDLQSSDIQNFYGDLGWRGPRAVLHINATLANSNLEGPGSVPVQLLDADPAAQFTGPNAIDDKYAKLSTTLELQLDAKTSLQGVLYYDNLREQLINGNGPNDLPCGPGPDAAYLCEGGPGGTLSTTRGGAPIPDFAPGANAYGYDALAQLNLNTTNTNGYGGSLQVTNTSPLFGLANRLVSGVSYDGGFTNYDADGYVGGIDEATRVYETPPGLAHLGLAQPGYLLDEPGTVPVGVVIRNAYYGAYVSDTLNITQKLAVTAGGRFNIANIALHDQGQPDPNAPGAGLTGRHYYMHANPALGATYDIAPALILYGGYSEENAAPTPAELSCASPQDSCSLANFQSGDPDLRQLITRTWEAGIRGGAAGPLGLLVSYTADYYHSVTNDDIEFLQSPFNPAGEGYFSNVGNVLRAGFDASLTISRAAWTLYAAYSRTNAMFEDRFIEQSNSPAADGNGNITVNAGDRLPGIPVNVFKFGGDYQLTARWHIGLSATVQSGVFLYGDEANETEKLPGYLVADLTTSYQLTPAWQVFGTIENLTDARYYNDGTFSPTGLDGGVYVAQAPDYSDPRSYSLAAPIGAFAGVRLKF
jgi:outer membrane receptor protein involved in Fe transport